jgi:hypothetical protein
MSNGAAASSGAAAVAAAAAIANAIKASGVLVKVKSDEFTKIITRLKEPLIVIAGPAFLSSSYKYLTSYKGLAFYTKSDQPLHLPGDAEIINSKKIHIPG